MLNENIRALRKAKGLSQEELAVRLNVVRQTVSKWEKGLSVPDADMLVAIGEAFDTPVSVLLGETVAPQRAVELVTGESIAGELMTGESMTGELRADRSGGNEPVTDGAKTDESGANEPRTNEPRANESRASELRAISEKLEVINLQLARRSAGRRRVLHIVFIVLCVLTAAGFAALISLGSPYLEWNYGDPETAVFGAAFHAFEWLFVRAAPLLFAAFAVGAALTRRRS